MQFERDLNSNFSEVFLFLRSLMLKAGLKELKRENITSYFSDEGGICYLRCVKDKLVVGVFKGSQLEDRYPLISSRQKVIRHLYYKSVEEVNVSMIENIINDSIIINIETKELKRGAKTKRSKRSLVSC